MALSLALVAGAVACLPGLIAGLCASILHPLSKKGQAGQAIRLGSLDTLPTDGTPVKSTVLMDQVDAWNRVANQPVGAVFLRRVGEKVQAFNVVCPHAGCSVEYKEEVDPSTNKKATKFFCPCHVASFDLEGKRTDATSPSPRNMDELAVELRGGEVWVEFQNFQVGIPSKVPAA
jgi:menaquinol-cytochrome c reductase iron-sulfur subunit